ncbi:MAG: hypothetical protein MJZ67_07445 [Bacteroidales bacterium]|nr:hypothetical protein [Bacteroidales bacterium]
MKKVFALLSLIAILVVMASCKEKRCACTWTRGDMEYRKCFSLEPKVGISSCAELNGEWLSSDSSTLVMRECVEEE